MKYLILITILAFALSSVPPRNSGGQIADTPKAQKAPPAVAVDTTSVQGQREALQEEAEALQEDIRKARNTSAEVRKYARKIVASKVRVKPDSIAMKVWGEPDTVVLYYPRRVLVPVEKVDTELEGRTWFGKGRVLAKRHIKACKLGVLFKENGWKNFWDRDYKPASDSSLR